MRADRTSRIAWIGLLVVTGLGLASCGGAGSGSNASCLMMVGCIDYTGWDWGMDRISPRCAAYSGETQAVPCPTENLVGSCATDYGLSTETIFRFYTPVWTAAAAEAECLNGGDTWLPL